MADSEAQAPSGIEGRHLLLYDGVCALCSRLVQFVLVHDHRRVFHFASLQSPTGRAAVGSSASAELTTFYVIADYQTPMARQCSRSRAALFVIGALGWPWKVAGVLGVLPTALLDRLYDLVARHRYRVFGYHDHCLPQRPEYKSRFIDS
jgi:predicted DCC family thiol-disulfide oxidoreductase YuxK